MYFNEKIYSRILFLVSYVWWQVHWLNYCKSYLWGGWILKDTGKCLDWKKKNFEILPTGWMDHQGHQRVPWLKKKNSKSYLQGGRIIKDTNGCLDQNIPNPTYGVDGPLRTSTGALTKEKIPSPTNRVDELSRTSTSALSKITSPTYRVDGPSRTPTSALTKEKI